jgi:hypothetical protein
MFSCTSRRISSVSSRTLRLVAPRIVLVPYGLLQFMIVGSLFKSRISIGMLKIDRSSYLMLDSGLIVFHCDRTGGQAFQSVFFSPRSPLGFPVPSLQWRTLRQSTSKQRIDAQHTRITHQNQIRLACSPVSSAQGGYSRLLSTSQNEDHCSAYFTPGVLCRMLVIVICRAFWYPIPVEWPILSFPSSLVFHPQ